MRLYHHLGRRQLPSWPVPGARPSRESRPELVHRGPIVFQGLHDVKDVVSRRRLVSHVDSRETRVRQSLFHDGMEVLPARHVVPPLQLVLHVGLMGGRLGPVLSSPRPRGEVVIMLSLQIGQPTMLVVAARLPMLDDSNRILSSGVVMRQRRHERAVPSGYDIVAQAQASDREHKVGELDVMRRVFTDPSRVWHTKAPLRHVDPVVAQLVLEQGIMRPHIEVDLVRHRRVAVPRVDSFVPQLVREVAPGRPALSGPVVAVGPEHALRLAAVTDALAPAAHLWPAKVAQLAFVGVDGEVAVHAGAPVHRPFGQGLYALARPSGVGAERVLRVAAVADALTSAAHLWPAKVAQLSFAGEDGEVAVHARAPVHRPFGQRLYAFAWLSASPSGGARLLARAGSWGAHGSIFCQARVFARARVVANAHALAVAAVLRPAYVAVLAVAGVHWEVALRACTSAQHPRGGLPIRDQLWLREVAFRAVWAPLPRPWPGYAAAAA